MVDHIYVAERSPAGLGDLVRAARKGAGYSQAELAREMTLRGFEITREAIASIETGNVDLPSKETLRGFSSVLGVTRAHLLEAAGWLDPGEVGQAAVIEELRAERQSLTAVLSRVDRTLARLESAPPAAPGDRRFGPIPPESNP